LRVRISLSSASVWTSASSRSRSISTTRPASFHLDVRDARTSRRQVDLSGELPCAQQPDEAFAHGAAAEHLEPAGNYEKQTLDALADPHQHFAARHIARASESRQPRDLRRGQRREGVRHVPPDLARPRRAIANRDYNRRMPLVDPGKKAPAFSLKDQNGQTH